MLVTGGAGFIGSHLSEALVARGDSVVVLDDLSTGKAANLDGLSGSSRMELIVGSVLDRRMVRWLVDRTDAVVHLASPVGVELIVSQPLRSIETIVHGTEAVLEAAVRESKKVLVASTSEVYGKNTDVLDEDADHVLGPTSVPRWAYANAKAIDEYLAFGYWQDRQVPTVVFRPFNTVGPRQTSAYGMVLPRFVAQALHGEDLTVYGDGTQQRCFCHVSDAVRAVLALLDEPRAIGRIFNIASLEEVSIGQLARRVVTATGSTSAIRTVPVSEHFGLKFEDMRRRRPDTRRIHDLTGWSPVVSLDEAIADVVQATRTSAAGEKTEKAA